MKRTIRLTESELINVIKKVISEQETPTNDPAWVTKLSNTVLGEIGIGNYTMKFKPNSRFVQEHTYAAVDNQRGLVLILPKSTLWVVTPSGYFMSGRGVVVPLNNFGYNQPGKTDTLMNGLRDGMYLSKVALGQGKNSVGEPIKPIEKNVLFSPHTEGIMYEGSMYPTGMVNYPSDSLLKKLQSFQA